MMSRIIQCFVGFRGVGFGGVLELYQRMVEKGFVPEMRTVVMLVKLFCENGRSDVGVELWGYLIQKGYCPHGHALVLLVTGLCCAGRVGEAYECFRQVVERGRWPSESGLWVLEGFLVKSGEHEKLRELYQMMNTLQANLDSYNSS
ncbi:hypothetical protein QJS10_CPA02g01505 [Acorus calamus]|uniref:Pentatricopeptide repeat-containing protein n=1 Tax=Acorus calamus TaxID=4465 RepID=A0AAV9FC54_ACOCL|nr:hypothetical protein QJS10_CPA02g01505 [Acorus calamus]